MIRSRQNQPQSQDGSGNPAPVADDLLRSFFERWQRLEEEKKSISDDLKEMFAEAKGMGFDTKAMRAVFREETGDKTAAEEFDAICDLYRSSLRGHRARPARTRENIEQFPNSSELTSSPAKTDTAGDTPPASPATNSNSFEPNPTPASRTDEPAAGKPLTAAGEPDNPDPHAFKADGGQPQNSDDAGAKSDGTHTIVGQGGEEPVHSCGQSGQQDASASQDRNEPVSESGTTATNSQSDIPLFLLKERQPLRPLCLSPSNCAGYGSKTCHRCLKAAETEGRAA